MRKKLLLLCMLFSMLFSMQNIIAADPNYIPNNTTKYDTDKPKEWRTTSSDVTISVDSIDDDWYSIPRTTSIEVTYTINEEASGEIPISLDDIMEVLVDEGYLQSVTPGDLLTMKINFVNNSSQELIYKNNSLLVTTMDTSEYESLSNPSDPYYEFKFNAVGFDQQKIPLSLTNFRTANDAIMSLCGRSKTQFVTIDDMLNLSDTLSQKGYTGSHALTQYYLDYYNSAYGTSATTLDELNKDALSDIFSGNASISQSYANSTEGAELEARMAAYDLDYPIANFSNSTRNRTISASFLEVEKEIIQVSYNYLYNEAVGLSFDITKSPLANENAYFGGREFSLHEDTLITHSIGSYMREESCYAEANTALSDIVLSPDGGTATLTVDMGFSNYVTNSFQVYLFGYSSSFLFQTYSNTGSVTLHKVDSQTMELISDKVTEFNLYRSTIEHGKEYYGKDDTWVTDQKEAKLFTTTDGILTIEDLEYGDYGFAEITAPEGYDLASEDLTFTIDEDNSDVSVNFKNSKTSDIPPLPIVETGSVTLRKVDSQTMKLISNKVAEFNLYRVSEEQGKEYYSKEDTWVIDQKEAKVFTTTNGILTIEDLEYGDYGFTEVTAPEGYNLASEDLTFTINKDNTDVSVNFKNSKTPDIPDVPDTPKVIPDTPKVTPPVATPVVKTSDTTSIIVWGLFSGLAAIMGIKMICNKRYTSSNK